MTNLAYKYEVIENTSKERRPKTQNRAITRRVVLDAILLSMLVIFCSFAYINGRARVTKIQSDINSTKSDIAVVQKEIDINNEKLEQIRSSKLVEEKAKTLLGMVYPTEEDKIYINSKETEQKAYAKEKNGIIEAMIK